MEYLNIEALERLIKQWSVDRGIFQHSDAKAQTLKAFSEMGELADNVIKTQPSGQQCGACKYREIDRDAVKDDIGDVVVCLINVATQYGLTLQECVEQAWNDIKDRKGHMTANGAFVKEE